MKDNNKKMDDVKGKVLYAHYDVVCGESRRGQMTVAINTEHSKATGVLHYGIAFCNPKDNFCKALGRRIAFNRLRCRANGITVPLGGHIFVHSKVEGIYNKPIDKIFPDDIIPHIQKRYFLKDSQEVVANWIDPQEGVSVFTRGRDRSFSRS